MTDIFQDRPDKDFPYTRFKLTIGEHFHLQAQFQHGFMRVALLTPKSERWASQILVDDIDNFTKLLQEATELVIMSARPAKKPRNGLRLIKED